MTDDRSALAVLADLSEAMPTQQALLQLLRHLAGVTGAETVRLWRRYPSGFVTELRWPLGADGGLETAEETLPDLAALTALPGVAAVAPVEGDTGPLGAVTLSGAGRPDDAGPGDGGNGAGLGDGGDGDDGAELELGDGARQELLDTALGVLSIWLLDERRVALGRQESHTDRLAGQLSAATRGLGTVRDMERRRVAAEIITLSTGPLTELRAHVDELEQRIVDGDPPPGPEDASRLLPELDDLIENFRVMVRGIHPIVLQTRGPKAAVAEVAAGLPRPVRISGSLPRRMEAELGSAVYHFASAALQTLVRSDGDDPIEVILGRADGRFEVTVRGATSTGAATLRASVAVEVDRFSALGGDVEVTVEEAGDEAVATLRGRLPDRLEPPAHPQPGLDTGLTDRVRDLALRVTARYGDGPGATAAQALVPRLEGPVRVGVRGFGEEPPELRALARRTPGILFLSESPATDFGSANFSSGEPDAILEPAGANPATPPNGSDDGRVDVRLAGPDGGVLVPAATWEALPGLLSRELLSRAGLLRSRSVLAAATEVLRRHPLGSEDDGRLGYQVERLRAQAHELVELEALARLRGGGLGLSRTQVRAAERLLGADGPAPHERLTVPASSTVEELRRAAIEQMQPWRDIAKHAVNRRQRETGAAVVRTCERLLAELTVRPRFRSS